MIIHFPSVENAVDKKSAANKAAQLAADALKGVSVLEKIEIERVYWHEENGNVYPVGLFADWVKLIDKPPMKMTLEFQKEEHECQG